MRCDGLQGGVVWKYRGWPLGARSEGTELVVVVLSVPVDQEPVVGREGRLDEELASGWSDRVGAQRPGLVPPVRDALLERSRGVERAARQQVEDLRTQFAGRRVRGGAGRASDEDGGRQS